MRRVELNDPRDERRPRPLRELSSPPTRGRHADGASDLRRSTVTITCLTCDIGLVLTAEQVANYVDTDAFTAAHERHRMRYDSTSNRATELPLRPETATE